MSDHQPAGEMFEIPAENIAEEGEKLFSEPLTFEQIKAKSDKYLLGNYRPAPLAFFFGQGEYLYDSEGRQYLDFVSGVAVTSLGHGEADLIEAIRDQAERVLHTSNLFYSQEQALLAEALVEHSFPGRVFFCNSGTEANEAAFKLARKHALEKGNAFRLVSNVNSFHGRTTASMSLTGQAKIHEGFGPLLEGITHLPADDIDALEQYFDQYGSETCAMFIELIQGEGGIIPLDKEYVRAVREITAEHDVILVVDEIQTGMGRTGKLFAYEHFDIVPDVMTLAKALGGGLPIGAMIAGEKYADLIGPGIHGATFGGNHLAARVAREVLRIIMGRELLNHANALSEYFFRRLSGLTAKAKHVKSVRGMGLHIGIELDTAGADVVTACREKGLLVNCTAESTIRLLPPLNINLESAAEGIDILEEVLVAF